MLITLLAVLAALLLALPDSGTGKASAAEANAAEANAAEANAAEANAGAMREIVIGAVLPLNGRQGMYGESVLLGLVTRIEEWNQANARRGLRVRLVVRDSESNPEQAVKFVHEFAAGADPLVPVIIGPILNRAVRESEKVAAAKKRVLVVPLGTTFEPDPGPVWTFRMAASGWAQARALARFMVHTIGRRKAAILTDPQLEISSAYGDYFAEAVEVEGAEVVCRAEFSSTEGLRLAEVAANGPDSEKTPAAKTGGEAEQNPGGEANLENYREALRKIAAAKPDTLFIPCYAVDVTAIIQVVAEFPELNDVRMCGPDLWDNQLVFDASGRRLIGSFFTSILQSSRTRYLPYQKFLSSMQAAGVEQPDAQIACAYEAATLVLLAIERSHDYSPETIRQALLSMHNEELATGVTSVTELGMVEKPIVIRVIRNRDGWPTPIYQESISNIQPLPSQEGKEGE